MSFTPRSRQGSPDVVEELQRQDRAPHRRPWVTWATLAFAGGAFVVALIDLLR